MKKVIFSAALLMGVAVVSFASAPNKNFKVNTLDATAKTATEQIYELKESPSGSVLFEGTESEIQEYNESNYLECDGNGANCTYVYQQGTSTRNTALERKHAQ